MSHIIGLGALIALIMAAFYPGAPVRTLIDGAPSLRVVVQSVADEIALVTGPKHAGGTGAAFVLDGKVVGVSDGDTVTLLDASKRQHRIRLLGIDAPEKAQAFGQRSRQALAGFVHRQQVQAQCISKDQYGRSLCKLVLGDKDINLQMVEAGMAWHYKAYAKSQPAADRGIYAQAQQRAMAAGAGLWREQSAVPPWEFRREENRRIDTRARLGGDL